MLLTILLYLMTIRNVFNSDYILIITNIKKLCVRQASTVSVFILPTPFVIIAQC